MICCAGCVTFESERMCFRPPVKGQGTGSARSKSGVWATPWVQYMHYTHAQRAPLPGC